MSGEDDKHCPNPEGRNQFNKRVPADWDPEWRETMLELYAQGATDQEVRANWRMGKEAWYRLRKEHPEFDDAVREGKDLAEAWYYKRGRMGIEEGRSFNSTAYIWLGKVRFGLSDRMEVNQRTNLSVDMRDKEQKQARLDELLGKAKDDGTDPSGSGE